MSKNIIIQEGGIGKQLTADKLKTNLVGGGSCLWVPEDEVILGTKSITNNGTYSAATDGLTGFSQVTVNVPEGNVTGRDPTTGQEKSVTVDPETGDLVETVVPSEIRVITPPTNPYGTYTDGQTITKDGMVVKAYDANGVYLQDVPLGEITISPTVAVYDESKDKKGEPTIIPDASVQSYYNYYDALNPATRVTYNETPNQGEPISKTVTATDGAILYVIFQSSRYYVYAISQSSFVMTVVANGITTQYNSSQAQPSALSGNTYHKTGFVELGFKNTGDIIKISPNPQPNWTKVTPPYMIGDLTFYDSDITPGKFGSPQTITASWPRPGDSKVLTDTFEILVAPGYGGDEGQNGNAGTPPPGMLIP